MDRKKKKAILVLHEIYGINPFIVNTCQKLEKAGFAVVCPNLIGRPPFPYEESQKAYDHFFSHTGFGIDQQINQSISQLKQTYDKVFVVGFSVGATLAWRCCEHAMCDGIVACYGSRIRDYTNLNPACPTLLLFAKEDSFDVASAVCKLQGKPHVKILEFSAGHGFLDFFSQQYEAEASASAEQSISSFLCACAE